MNEIVNHIVNMVLNNQDYNKSAEESIATTERLKQSLDFNEVSDGFGAISRNARGVDLGPLAEAAGVVGQKFSVLEQLAIGALRNIGAKIEATAERMVKTFTTDNIAAGFQKFTEKTQSVATLVAQGYALEDVNSQLERLNWFSDETSYSFTDMVNNISKFTATGEQLEPSVNAMEGIATWAALSGQNATTASRAMYQLAQAMSKGALKYDDYKSIQNANMDTQEFRNKALETAIALGKVKKTAKGTYRVLASGKEFSFAEMFSSDALSREKWFDKDIMMGTFQKYSAAVDQIYEYAEANGMTAAQAMAAMGDSIDEFGLKAFKAAQEARSWHDVVEAIKDAVGSGWMTTFENIFGNYQEAAAFWTELSNKLYEIFATGGEARNDLLKAWKDMGGRDDFVQSVWNLMDALISMVNVVKDGFHDIFPPMTAERLKGFTENMLDFTGKIKDFFSGNTHGLGLGYLADALDGWVEPMTTVQEHVKGISKHVEKLSDISDGVKGIVKPIKELVAPVETITDFAEDVAPGIEKHAKNLPPLLSKISDITADVRGIVEPLSIVKEGMTGLLGPLNSVSNFAEGVAPKIEEHVKNLPPLVSKVSDFAEKTSNIINLGPQKALPQILDKIADITDSASKVANPVAEVSESVKELMGPLNTVTDFAEGILPKVEKHTKNVPQLLDKMSDFSEGVARAERPIAAIRGGLKDIQDPLGKMADFAEGVVPQFEEHAEKLPPILEEDNTALGRLKRTLSGVFAIFDIGKQLLGAVVAAFKPLARSTGNLVYDMLGVTASWGDWLKALSESIRANNSFAKVTEVLSKVISGVRWVVRELTSDFLSVREAIISFGEGGGGLAGIFEVAFDKIIAGVRFVLKAFNKLTGIDVGFDEWGNVDNEFIQSLRDMRDEVVDFFYTLTEKAKVAWYVLSSVFSGKSFKEVFLGLTNRGFDLNGLFGQDVADEGSNFLAIAQSLYDRAQKFKDLLTTVWDVVKEIGSRIGKVIKVTWKFLTTFLSINETMVSFTEGGEGLSGVLEVIMDKLAEVIRFVFNLFEAITGIDLSKVGGIIVGLIQDIRDGLTTVVSKIQEKFQAPGFDFFKNILEGIKNILSKLKNLIFGVNDETKSAAKGLKSSGLMDFLGKIFDGLINIASVLASGVGTVIKKFFDGLANLDISTVVEFFKGLAAGGMALALKNFGDSFKSVTGFIGGLKDTLSGFKSSGDGTVDAVKTLAEAILMLAVAVLILASIDPISLYAGITAMEALFSMLKFNLTSIAKEMSGFNVKLLKSISTTIIKLSVAILILAFAVAKLGKLPMDTLAKGIGAVIILLLSLAGAMFLLSKFTIKDPKKIKALGSTLIKISVALLILAVAVKKLGKMSLEDLGKGLGAIVIMLGALAGAMFLLSKYTVKDPKKLKVIGNTLIKIAAAMLILSFAVKKLGSMSLVDLAKGVISVVVLLGAMTGAAILLSKFSSPGKIAGASAALIVLGIALGLIAGIVKTLGKMPIENLAKGLLGLIVVFAIMAVAMAAMSSDALAPGKIAAISASMILLGVAMLLLVGAVAALGAMDMTTLLQGILGLGTVLLVLAAAAYVIQNLGVTVTMLAMGAALALIGASVFLVAAGIALLAVAIDLLAISGAAGAAALIAMLDILLIGFLELIPSLITVLTELIIAILDMIIEVTPKLVEAVVTVVGSILDGLVELIPQIVETVLVLVTAILQSIHDHAYEIVDLCIQILLDVLKAIRDNLEEVVNTVVDIIVTFVDTVAANLDRIIQAGVNLFLSFIEGITSALQNNRERVENDVRELIRGIINMVFSILTGSIEGIKDAARDIMDSGFITGIREKINKAKQAIKDLIDKVIEKIKSFVTNFKDAAKDTIEGFIKGIKDKISDAVEGIRNFGSRILDGLKGILGISSPSKVTRGYGQYVDEGLILGMEDLSSAVVTSAEDVGGGAMDALAAAVAGANDLIDTDMEDPVITPVIDLSQIQNGVNAAHSLFDDDFTFGGSATLRGVALGSAVQSPNPADFGSTSNVSNLNYGGNTFYITGDNPRDIADQVASILQLRTERAERAWA